MLYFSNINTKNDTKAPPIFNQLPFCPCLEPTHQNYTLTLICIEKNCSRRGLICTMCQYEHHRQHQNNTIPVKIFLDKYKESFKDFQLSQNKKELKIDPLNEISIETLNILKNFHAKISSEISNLQNIIKIQNEKEVKSFLQEEENNKDPFVKIYGNAENFTTEESKNFISALMEKIIYKENESTESESFAFSHTSNEVLFQKFEHIKQNALKNKEILSNRLDLEYSRMKEAFQDLESKFIASKNNKGENNEKKEEEK